MRYEVKIDGALAASFLKARDALAFVAAVLRKQPHALPDIVDGDIGAPFDRASILGLCRERLESTAMPSSRHNSRGSSLSGPAS